MSATTSTPVLDLDGIPDFMPDLATYDVIVINSSAGKDSQAMLDYVVEQADAAGVDRARLVVFHADLGRVEWDGTAELAQEQAETYGLRFEKITRNQGDLLTHIAARRASLDTTARNLRREADAVDRQVNGLLVMLLLGAVDPATAEWFAVLIARVLISRSKACRSEAARKYDTPAWPSSTTRYCTSDHKRSQGRKLLTRLVNERYTGAPVRVLYCMGFRREESPARAKKVALRRDEAASNGRRHVDEWLPILEWTVEQVWARIQQAGTRHHWAYDAGMPRLSCSFCVLASRSALVRAAQLRPELAAEYAALEQRIRHRFRMDLSMAEIVAAAAECSPVEIEGWAA